MFVEIKLLGELGQKFGRVWRLAINSPAQAIRAIAANCPELTEYLAQSEKRGICYRVVIDNPLGIDKNQLDYPVGDRLIIAPIIQGSGGGLGKIILGAALVVGSFFMPAAIPIFGASISSLTVGLLGAALIFGGISEIMSPVPKMNQAKRSERTNSEPPKSNSFLFDRAAELGDAGQSVPVLYGQRIIVDPIIIGSSIVTQEIPVG